MSYDSDRQRLPDGVTVPFDGQPGDVDDSGWRRLPDWDAPSLLTGTADYALLDEEGPWPTTKV